MDIIDAIGFGLGIIFVGMVLLTVGGFIGWYTIYINFPRRKR